VIPDNEGEMKMMRLTRHVPLILMLMGASLAHAQVYKTIDANGKVQYTDTPPAGAKKSEVVKDATNVKSASDRTDWQEKDREFRARKMQQDEASRKEEEESRQIAKERNKACLLAREQIDDLNRGVPLYRVNAKGERVYLDEAERADAMKRARQSVADNCPR
jgi:Skp family chaperone for outer membrane proteins